jgi:uncharacterized Zn-finger protein
MENSFEIRSFNNIACSKFVFFIQKSKPSLNNSSSLLFKNIVKKKNKKSIEVKFKCPFNGCDNAYSLKNKLLAHLRTHYGMKPYKCNYCLKSFNDKGNLKTHLRVHTGERPYKCSICSKAFKTEGQLREHLGSHCKDKPFQCPYCLKYYKRKGVVKNHMLIHYEDPSFNEKKDFYKKVVDNLDNKNLFNVIDFYHKNSNSSIGSTKDESSNGSLVPKCKDNMMKYLSMSSDILNVNNTDFDSSENSSSFEKSVEFEKEEDNKSDLYDYDKKSKGDDLFDDILKKNGEDLCVEKCEKNDVEAKFEFKINENEILEEKSILLHDLIENKNDMLLLEDIL